jgi:acetoin utilization deacetylase AcuC-like enzyme
LRHCFSPFLTACVDMTSDEIEDSARYYEQLSLYVHQGTTHSALLSCGGVIEACLNVAEGKMQKSFAIVRPPGHHAEPDEHMGFCFFNNVAVATRVVQKRTACKKILILDWLAIYCYQKMVLVLRSYISFAGMFIMVSSN